MNLLRLQPVIYLMTPLGIAEAYFKQTFDSHDVQSIWHTFQCETKEPWEWPNPLVRICESITGMRDRVHTPIDVSDNYFETLIPHIMRHQRSPLYRRAWEALNGSA